MKHYGLKRRGTGGWLRDQSGMIFWTTSKAVANEQLKMVSHIFPDDFEVCEFKDDKETEQDPTDDAGGWCVEGSWRPY